MYVTLEARYLISEDLSGGDKVVSHVTDLTAIYVLKSLVICGD